MGLGICSDLRGEPHKLCNHGLSFPEEELGQELTIFNEKRESSIEQRDSRGNNLQTYNNDVLKLETSNPVACSTIVATDETSDRKVLLLKSKQHQSKSGTRNSISVDDGQLNSLVERDFSKAEDILSPVGAKEGIRFSSLSLYQSSTDDDNHECSLGSSVRKTSEGELRKLGLLGAHSSLKMSSPEGSSIEHLQKVSKID